MQTPARHPCFNGLLRWCLLLPTLTLLTHCGSSSRHPSRWKRAHHSTQEQPPNNDAAKPADQAGQATAGEPKKDAPKKTADAPAPAAATPGQEKIAHNDKKKHAAEPPAERSPMDLHFLLSMDYTEAKTISAQSMEIASGARIAADHIEVLSKDKEDRPTRVRAKGKVFLETSTVDGAKVLCQEVYLNGTEAVLRGKPIMQRGGSIVEGLEDKTVFYMLGNNLRVIGLHRLTNEGSMIATMPDLGPWTQGPNPLLPALNAAVVPISIREEMQKAADAEAILQKNKLEANKAPGPEPEKAKVPVKKSFFGKTKDQPPESAPAPAGKKEEPAKTTPPAEPEKTPAPAKKSLFGRAKNLPKITPQKETKQEAAKAAPPPPEPEKIKAPGKRTLFGKSKTPPPEEPKLEVKTAPKTTPRSAPAAETPKSGAKDEPTAAKEATKTEIKKDSPKEAPPQAATQAPKVKRPAPSVLKR